jgi:hypothetical protein
LPQPADLLVEMLRLAFARFGGAASLVDAEDCRFSAANDNEPLLLCAVRT